MTVAGGTGRHRVLLGVALGPVNLATRAGVPGGGVSSPTRVQTCTPARNGACSRSPHDRNQLANPPSPRQSDPGTGRLAGGKPGRKAWAGAAGTRHRSKTVPLVLRLHSAALSLREERSARPAELLIPIIDGAAACRVTPPGYPKLTPPGIDDCCGGRAKRRRKSQSKEPRTQHSRASVSLADSPVLAAERPGTAATVLVDAPHRDRGAHHDDTDKAPHQQVAELVERRLDAELIVVGQALLLEGCCGAGSGLPGARARPACHRVSEPCPPARRPVRYDQYRHRSRRLKWVERNVVSRWLI